MFRRLYLKRRRTIMTEYEFELYLYVRKEDDREKTCTAC